MKTTRRNWVSAAASLFIAIVILLSVIVVFRTGVQLVFVQKLQMHSPVLNLIFYDCPEYTMTPEDEMKQEANRFGENVVDIDWEGLYPFREEDLVMADRPAVQVQKAEPSLLDRYIARVDLVKQKVSSAFRKMIPFYDRVVMWGSSLEDLIGWNIPQYSEYNPAMELEDNYFITVEPLRDSTEGVESLVSLDGFCREQGSRMFVVMPPSKVDREKDLLISGQIDFGNQNQDAFLQALREKNIDCLDLRQNVQAEGLDTHSLFFTTDHHWKPETGLWAAGIIADHLNAVLDSRIDTGLFDPDAYEKTLYEDWFLGSLGKKMTLTRAHPENISLLMPRYPSRLQFRVPNMDIDVTGDFSVTYDMAKIREKDLMNKDAYAAYAYCNKPQVQFISQEDRDPMRILVLKDSFANVVTPFLAQGVSRLDVLDLRIFTGSVREYIRQLQPDAVIVLYSKAPAQAVNWNSHQDLFDFR